MSQVIVIGGYGKIALLLAHELHSRGHEITSISRNAERSDEVKKSGAKPIGTEHLLIWKPRGNSAE